MSSNYPPAIRALIESDRLPELGPGTPNRAVQPALAALTLNDLGRPIRDASMARAFLAGLWLLHDFLEESHSISQEIATPTGSYWHAIMHRREPDAWNSKYWWRRVGKHPVFDELAAEAAAIGYPIERGAWDPDGFVDACEAERGKGSERAITLRRVQLAEMRLLLDWCLRQAV